MGSINEKLREFSFYKNGDSDPHTINGSSELIYRFDWLLAYFPFFSIIIISLHVVVIKRKSNEILFSVFASFVSPLLEVFFIFIFLIFIRTTETVNFLLSTQNI